MLIEHLRPFQREFLRNAFRPQIRTACMSVPRGNSKSTIASHILAGCLTPGHEWHEPGHEYLLVASSLDQSSYVYSPLRRYLEERSPGEYRFVQSQTRVGIVHKATNTRLRVLSSSGKTSMGIVGCPLLVYDEPASHMSVAGGELLWDSIRTAQGKPGSKMRVILIGTLWPQTRGWYVDLVQRGSRGSTYVFLRQGDVETWDRWGTIRKANPLVEIDAGFRRTLLEERDQAREDTRLKAAFVSARLNVPVVDEARALLSVQEWERVIARDVPERNGARPVVGIDLGSGRAWSAAVAIYPNGRTEALAVAPGVPSIDAQERRDRVPRGTYARLVEAGVLHLAHNREVQTPGQLVSAVVSAWGRPHEVVCDRLRVPELRSDFREQGLPAPLTIRKGLWSESNEDVNGLRRLAKNGPLSVDARSRDLLTASLSVAMVQPDTSGNIRLRKADRHNNTGRDDAAVALTLAAGAHLRRPTRPRWQYRGVA